MIYTIEKCPQCKTTLRFLQPKKSGVHFGIPFKRCPNCGCYIKVENTKEAISFTTFNKYYYFFQTLFAPYFIMFSLYIGTFIQMPVEFRVVFGILIIIACIALFKRVKSIYDKEFQESLDRLKDINYLNILLHFKFITKQEYEDFIRTGHVRIEKFSDELVQDNSTSNSASLEKHEEHDENETNKKAVIDVEPVVKNKDDNQIIKYCRICGTKLNEGSSYCHNCGTKVKE